MFEDEVLSEEADVEEDESSTYLTFDLGGQTLGVDVRFVREIIDVKKITPLPNAPSEVLGVVDVRGQSVPIVDLGRRLGVAPGDWAEEARMVVLEFATGYRNRQIGIQADRVRNVDQIAQSEIEPIPRDGFALWDAGVLLGLSRRNEDLIVLIDLQGIFGDAGDELDLTAGAGFF
ncbi:chemotaxis protein CheW [Citreimonas salinaria]|uniref:Purine-binding chemotaxis protein CheW n=1 Tax=Citreimonas salinaria TaxID=321339 RepID=A0A1H3MR99_9RHOB|nr:chemotaxis protein CheW [Citreimonas salinaria]SDY79222.1 purine-binding chemotaxis protein CheW [Citreimonas salinaria]